MQQGVAGLHQPVEPGFLQAHGFKIIGAFGFGQRRDLGFDFGGNHHSDRALGLGARFDQFREIVAGSGGAFLDIAGIEDGRRGQQSERMEQLLFVRLALDQTRRLAVAQ